MAWMRALGAIAVLSVLCLVGGSAASLGGGMRAWAAAVPAAAAAAVIAVGVAITVLAAGPQDDWTANPYW
jgi:hypothetical protein